MSTDATCAPEGGSLRHYVLQLISRLGECDPDALARLHAVVGARRARIVVGAEAVLAHFRGDTLSVIEDDGSEDIDGAGITDRGTVLDLMDGYVEVSEAITCGRLEMIGSVENVERMSIAIEILLDTATRAPPLQELARAYRIDGSQAKYTELFPSPRTAPPDFLSDDAGSATRELLEQLDLLP